MDKVRSFDELPVTLRVEDLTAILDIGRNTAYELVRSGQIRSVRVGRQIRIPRDEVVHFLSARNCGTEKER
jgi:excisionase family DNA binding protein